MNAVGVGLPLVESGAGATGSRAAVVNAPVRVNADEQRVGGGADGPVG